MIVASPYQLLIILDPDFDCGNLSCIRHRKTIAPTIVSMVNGIMYQSTYAYAYKIFNINCDESKNKMFQLTICVVMMTLLLDNEVLNHLKTSWVEKSTTLLIT